MRKPRRDSKWQALPVAQSAQLEGWLFVENIAYARVAELVRQEFGLETSVPGVARYYHRRAFERREMRQETLRAMMSVEESRAAGQDQVGEPDGV